ncbi:MAG: CopG family transcriptional regulator [Candidatus Odinarchaeota archaeon]
MSDIPRDRLQFELNADVLAKIDVLLEEKIYKSRADFIEKAVQTQLGLHKTTFEKYEKSKAFAIGLFHYGAKELERIVAKGKRLEIKVLGGLVFADDVTPELASQAIDKISLAGILRAPKDVLPVLAQRRFTLLGRPYHEIQGSLPPGEEESDLDPE